MGFIIFLAIVGFVIYLFSSASDNSSKKTKNPSRYTYSSYRRSYRYNTDHARIERWKRKRAEFEIQKTTDFFRDWKREQYFCQNKQCAWCRKPISLHSPDTHVDHIKPLMWWGTNEYTNLLLACRECNEEKGDSTVGWAGRKGAPGTNYKPTWIKPNRCCRNFKPKETSIQTAGGLVVTNDYISEDRHFTF